MRALDAEVVPRVPLQGSQSASDLIPNAHLALGVLDVDTLEAKEGGIINSAAHMRSPLEGSQLVGTSDRPRDPFSLRCLPQIHGAVRRRRRELC